MTLSVKQLKVFTMSKVAALSFDSRSSKWMATFGGRILAASYSKDYVIKHISNGRCTKANQLGVTSVLETTQTTVNEVTGKTEKVERFGINERFDFLADFVNMVADRTCPSLLVTGEGGLGKTYTVNKAMQDAGMKNASAMIGFSTDNDLLEHQSRGVYSVVKGYSTAKGLYRTLFENRNRVIIFDDCDSILRDPVALNLLKGALDSYDKRIISWNTESFSDDELPRSFEFRGGVIFISNLPIFKIDQAIRSRAICVDVSMNTAQKIERMGAIIKTEEFMPEYDLEVKERALRFLDEMKNDAADLNLRTLISITKVAARGGQWQRRAEYLLTVV
jgi:hypothetical protein